MLNSNTFCFQNILWVLKTTDSTENGTTSGGWLPLAVFLVASMQTKNFILIRSQTTLWVDSFQKIIQENSKKGRIVTVTQYALHLYSVMLEVIVGFSLERQPRIQAYNLWQEWVSTTQNALHKLVDAKVSLQHFSTI